MAKIGSGEVQEVRLAGGTVVGFAILLSVLASVAWWFIFSKGDIGRLSLAISLLRMSPIRVLGVGGIVLVPTVVGPLLCACSNIGILGIFLGRIRSEAAVYSLIIMCSISLFLAPIGWFFLFFTTPH